MEITEEQRKRAETNRLAALAKLNRPSAKASANQDVWRLFRCRKISDRLSEAIPVVPLEPKNLASDMFLIILEICAPDAFSIMPEPLEGFAYPGEIECLQKIGACLSSVGLFCSMESQSGGRASVYALKDYDVVLKCLKKFPGIQLQEIPWKTLAVVKKFSHSFMVNHWIPCIPSHLADDEVDVLYEKLPTMLRNALLPFQLDGLRFGLRRGGRCLIADEMGLGKTIQAIAIASCFMNEGPILVVCPAILRFSWAEELERWLPFCLPTDIHLVFGHQNNLIYLTKCPKVVVISYTMLHRLRKTMLEREWALMIVDESHNMRCTKKIQESQETQAVLDVAAKVKRITLLSGTPSLSRPYDIFHQINMLWPGLLGKDKYEFAKSYCKVKFSRGSQGKIFKDFSSGIRLEELNVLLKQTVMIRRLKEHVLVQLPPKRRQVIRLMLNAIDITLATTMSGALGVLCMDRGRKRRSLMNPCNCQNDFCGDGEDFHDTNDNKGCHRTARQLSYQELGIAKLSGFREWLSNHSIITESESGKDLDANISSKKMIIFAHHLKVLDGVQEFASEKGIGFVRIDGSTLPRDRQAAVQTFKSSTEVSIAIIGITAGGVGLDFSSAQSVVFLELPKSASEMLQAEDRAHRRGQTNAVNIYLFCAKDSLDESHWRHLNMSLFRVSSMMNGKVDAIPEIEADRVFDLDLAGDFSHCINSESSSANDLEVETSYRDTISESDGNIDENVNYKKEAVAEKCESGELRTNEQMESCTSNLIQTVAPQFEVDKTSVSEMVLVEGSAPGRNVDGNALDVSKAGSAGVISIRKIDKADDRDEVLENIKHKNISFSNTNSTIQSDEKCDLKSEEVEGEAAELIHADTDSSIQADSLRFEVSQYTGRIHLYACIPGKDSRPRPLFENFRPEELESMVFCATDMNKETAPKLMKENPGCRDVCMAFIREWNDLRPIERNKLQGKPLQLPLSLELYYLKENINHGCEGLLKGGSKRRVTPLSDISCPLPLNAVWKKISLHSGCAKKEKEYTQGWTMSDEPLCKLCQKPCNGKLAKSPEFFEDLFCDLSCFEEYRIRTSQRSLRAALFQIEHGVCTQCKLDCHKLVECIRPLSVARRREHIEKVAPKVASNKNLFDKLVYEPNEGNAWHADHIVPVYKGGGECKLENMRTLCVACHSEVTAEQRTDRRLTRIKAKEQLKLVMRELKDGSRSEQMEVAEVWERLQKMTNCYSQSLEVHTPEEKAQYPKIKNLKMTILRSKRGLRETSCQNPLVSTISSTTLASGCDTCCIFDVPVVCLEVSKSQKILLFREKNKKCMPISII
ncbi:uncharacterized protein LOC131219229 isoform X2 [Magnolia sinica]|uniref:uncharacterized protein LOC131219229 isoform X2 n=1 Tax=Magnolia sinica TaxID=86752 RepID=UPI00265B5016|nr:uncharacterized protein LOC131219229 isoform X2 [Magnolia sinica]